MKNYIKVEDFANKNGLSARSVRNYCAQNRILGAVLRGKTWYIPENAKILKEKESRGEDIMVDGLITYLNHSYTQYHAIEIQRNLLLGNGYKELKENETWNLKAGHRYFVVKAGSSLVAFNLPKSLTKDFHYQIIASHSDSPTFKLKANPILVENGFVKLNVEKYGGMIMSSWLDKPLTIAGRVMVETQEGVETRLTYIDQNLLTIPNVAIHMNREINNGFVYNSQVDMLPLLGEANEDEDYFASLMKLAGVEEKVISHDLYLVNRERATLSGLHKEYISSPKLDNLECAYLTLNGLVKAKDKRNVISMCVCFDNEEVGSGSVNGADSSFLKNVMSRIASNFGLTKEEKLVSISKSFVISADNAHGVHPNHPEFSDSTNKVRLNKGIVIKYNANMKYCSDAYSSGALKLVLNKTNIPYQEYENKSNMPGGSTLGNILQSSVSTHIVDIGLPQLAMHSSYEVAGVKDIEHLFNLSKAYFSGNLELDDESIKF